MYISIIEDLYIFSFIWFSFIHLNFIIFLNIFNIIWEIILDTNVSNDNKFFNLLKKIMELFVDKIIRQGRESNFFVSFGFCAFNGIHLKRDNDTETLMISWNITFSSNFEYLGISIVHIFTIEYFRIFIVKYLSIFMVRTTTGMAYRKLSCYCVSEIEPLFYLWN